MQKFLFVVVLTITVAVSAQAQAWTPVGGYFNGGINALTSFGGKLYMGGNFSIYDGNTANFSADFDPNTTTITPHANVGFTGTTINSLYVNMSASPAVLFALGDIKTGTTTTAPANSVAWTAATSTWGDASYKVNGMADAMAYNVASGTLFVGGAFNSGGLSYVGRRVGTAWQAAGSGFNGTVQTMLYYAGTVYAGGDFTLSGTTACNHLAKWNNTTSKWEAVGTGVNGSVRSLAASNGILYVGGNFTQAGTVASRFLVKYDGTNFVAATGGGMSGGTKGINTMIVSNAKIYIGGDFTQAGTVVSPYLVRFDGATFTAFNAGLTAPVASICVVNSVLYCGEQALAGGKTYLKKWDATAFVATEDATTAAPQLISYPNPTDGIVYINNTNNAAINTIQIASIQGSIMGELANLGVQNTYEVDLQNYPTGVYILTCTATDGVRESCKIVKR